MAKMNLTGMDVGALLSLRDQVLGQLEDRRALLEQQLGDLNGSSGSKGQKRVDGRSTLKGKKAEPKFRDPDTGQTWAARGAKPRWLVAKMKEGAKLEDFAIGSSSTKASKAAGKKGKRGRPRKAA